MIDLLVIGAGLSGLMAGIAAARQGAHTRIVATGVGALLWTPGTIGVLGYLPDRQGPVRSPLETLDALGRIWPQHPYTLLDARELRQHLETFRELTYALGLPYVGAADGGNLLLPSPSSSSPAAVISPPCIWPRPWTQPT